MKYQIVSSLNANTGVTTFNVYGDRLVPEAKLPTRAEAESWIFTRLFREER